MLRFLVPINNYHTNFIVACNFCPLKSHGDILGLIMEFRFCFYFYFLLLMLSIDQALIDFILMMFLFHEACERVLFFV